MKHIISIILLTLAVHFGSCQSAGAGNGIKKNIPVAEFEQKLSTAGIQLIDVRTPEEFAGGHLKNAINININGADYEAAIAKLDKSKPVLVYCLSGGRSGSAASDMHDKGFSEVYNMEGGIMKWKGSGKPVETGAGAPAKAAGMTMDEFNKQVAQKHYVFVDFNAPWCAPCRQLMPIMEKIVDARKDKMALIKINVDDNKDLAEAKKIESIPYVELYMDGKLVWSHMGLMTEEEILKEAKLQ